MTSREEKATTLEIENKTAAQGPLEQNSARDFKIFGLGVFIGFTLAMLFIAKNPDVPNKLKVGSVYHPYQPSEHRGNDFVLLFNGHKIPYAFQVEKPIPTNSFKVMEVNGEIIYFPLNDVTNYIK